MRKIKAKMRDVSYSSAVGSLMYNMVCTRPDLAHAMSVVSWFMENLGKAHWGAVKWMFKYLRGSLSSGLVYGGAEKEIEAKILGYFDVDYAADQDRRRSTTGYVFKIWDVTVSWKVSLQHVVALSTTEAE